MGETQGFNCKNAKVIMTCFSSVGDSQDPVEKAEQFTRDLSAKTPGSGKCTTAFNKIKTVACNIVGCFKKLITYSMGLLDVSSDIANATSLISGQFLLGIYIAT